MYEVDYSKKETSDSKCSSLKKMKAAYTQCLTEVNPKNIRVSQMSQVTMGGIQSTSPALDNPRVFVMDKNKTITLPVVLSDEKKIGKVCTVYYDITDKETSRNCDDMRSYVTSFAGLKQFSTSLSGGLKESFSQNYSSRFNLTDGNQNPRSINSYSMRVGYAGDALFFLSDDFGHFMLP